MFEFNGLFVSIAASAGVLFFLVYLFVRYAKQFSSTVKYPSIEHAKKGKKSWRTRYRKALIALRFLCLILLLIAFARPQKGQEIQKTSSEGIAIQMVLDRSSSMKEVMSYQGGQFTRLDVVKKVFQAFVEGDSGKELQGRDTDMIGLSTFARFVEENVPLTLDHGNLTQFANSINLAQKVEDGTNIGDAIYYSTLQLISTEKLLEKAKEKKDGYKIQSKIIILLTDGEQTVAGTDMLEAAQFAKKNKIKIYTIAIVGSGRFTSQNSLLGQFFSSGQREINTTTIEQVAKITGGLFSKASSGEALKKIYEQIDQLEKTNFEERFTTYHERFPQFVTWALGILLLEILLSQTLFRKIP